jgi:preprotein translocase subunit SecY
MLSNVKNIFKVEDLRNKLMFTFAMVAVYRFGAALRVPGIDSQAVRQLRGEAHPKVQVPNCTLALATGIGGLLGSRHGSGTVILERA